MVDLRLSQYVIIIIIIAFIISISKLVGIPLVSLFFTYRSLKLRMIVKYVISILKIVKQLLIFSSPYLFGEPLNPIAFQIAFLIWSMLADPMFVFHLVNHLIFASMLYNYMGDLYFSYFHFLVHVVIWSKK